MRSSISAGARPLPVASARALVGTFAYLQAARGDDVQRAGTATSTISHIEENGRAPLLGPSVISKLAGVLAIKDPLTVAEFRDAMLWVQGQPPDSWEPAQAVKPGSQVRWPSRFG